MVPKHYKLISLYHNNYYANEFIELCFGVVINLVKIADYNNIDKTFR